MTEFTEHLTPERRAQLAINEYTYADPAIGIGGFGEARLREWRRNCSGVALNPEQKYLTAWIDTELAVAVRQGLPNDQVAEEPLELLRYAAEAFADVAADPSVQNLPLLKAQAYLARGGVSVMQRLYGGMSRDNAFSNYMRLQGAAAKETLRHLAATGSARAKMLADTLTMIMLLSSTSEGFIPMPPTPRNLAATIDGYYRCNAMFIDTPDYTIWNVRVANDGPGHMLVVPPAALLQHQYPSNTGNGTLEALIAQQDILDRSETLPNASQAEMIRAANMIDKTRTHIERVLEPVCTLLREQQPQASYELPPAPADRRQWYRELHAQQLPYIVDAQLLDEAIAQHEALFIEGGLGVRDARELSHMYIESGIGRAMNMRATALQVIGDFDRAEDVLIAARANPESTSDVVFHLRLNFDMIAVPLYRALATHDEAISEYMSIYQEALVDLSRSAIEHYAAITDKTSQVAKQLDAFIQQLTQCLLVSYNGGGALLALPPTARQAGEQGWQVSVWAETIDGFEVPGIGRLRIGEAANPGSLSEGIVTVTPAALGQKAPHRTATLQMLCDEIEGVPESPKQQGKRSKQLGKAWDALDKAITAAHE